jgi:hypothetical protein
VLSEGLRRELQRPEWGKVLVGCAHREPTTQPTSEPTIPTQNAAATTLPSIIPVLIAEAAAKVAPTKNPIAVARKGKGFATDGPGTTDHRATGFGAVNSDRGDR